MEGQAEVVGKAFVQHYYQLFDTDRASLKGLYQPSSMLTFEGQTFLGVEDISNKLVGLAFESCQHSITTIDCQPSSFSGGILVFVSGRLQLAGEEHQLRFSQVSFYLLIPNIQGNLPNLNSMINSFPENYFHHLIIVKDNAVQITLCNKLPHLA